MLDLQASIHLEKVELAAVGVVNELHCTGIGVGNAAEQGFGGAEKLLPNLVCQVGGRAFFHHLLVAALAGAVAFTQCHGSALAVAKHLHFDMASASNEFFQEHAVVGEVVGSEAFDAIECSTQVVGAMTQLHANTAAASGSFQHHWIANRVGCAEGAVQ